MTYTLPSATDTEVICGDRSHPGTPGGPKGATRVSQMVRLVSGAAPMVWPVLLGLCRKEGQSSDGEQAANRSEMKEKKRITAMRHNARGRSG
jgi:hypothetical protein